MFGKVVKVIDNKFGFIQVLEGTHLGKQVYFAQDKENSLRKDFIVQFEVSTNDEGKLQAESIKLFEFDKSDRTTVKLPTSKQLLGIVETYDSKLGYGFIEVQTETGPVKQYVHYSNITTKKPCYLRLFRYEVVYVDIEPITEGTHSGKSQCVNVRSVFSKLICEIRKRRKLNVKTDEEATV